MMKSATIVVILLLFTMVQPATIEEEVQTAADGVLGRLTAMRDNVQKEIEKLNPLANAQYEVARTKIQQIMSEAYSQLDQYQASYSKMQNDACYAQHPLSQIHDYAKNKESGADFCINDIIDGQRLEAELMVRDLSEHIVTSIEFPQRVKNCDWNDVCKARSKTEFTNIIKQRAIENISRAGLLRFGMIALPATMASCMTFEEDLLRFVSEYMELISMCLEETGATRIFGTQLYQ